MIPQTGNNGVCISLAYCPSSDDVVISYRPKFDMSTDGCLSQPSLTPSQVIGQGVQGSHVLFKRLGGSHFQPLGSSCANVSNIRLPKCVIMDIGSESRWLASGDEGTCELVLQELPSITGLKFEDDPVTVHTILMEAFTSIARQVYKDLGECAQKLRPAIAEAVRSCKDDLKHNEQFKKMKKSSLSLKKSCVLLDTMEGFLEEEQAPSHKEHLEFKGSKEEFELVKRGERTAINHQAYEEMWLREIEQIKEQQAKQ